MRPEREALGASGVAAQDAQPLERELARIEEDRMLKRSRHWGWLSVIVLGLALAIGVACSDEDDSGSVAATGESGGGSQAAAAPAAPSTIVQVGELAAPSSGSQAATDGWETDAARMLGLRLIAQLDSSGDDAWDVSEHELVYFSAQGPGYGGILASNVDESSTEGSAAAVQSAPGISIHDANTREAIATVQYDTGVEAYTENHGLGVSPDGQWLYTQGNHPDSKIRGNSVLMIINARTLKIDKIIETRVHHVRVIHDSFNDRDLVLVEGWGSFFALDPNDDNRVVAAVDPSDMRGAGYLGFGDPSGKWLVLSVRTGFRESDGGVMVVSLEDWKVKARINTFDGSPIWVAFLQDGSRMYVSDGHDSKIAEIDMTAENPNDWRVIGIANAGGIGPYGVHLNWDDTRIYSISKGEASHNQGKSVGITAPGLFSEPDQYRGWGTTVGEIVTNCLRGDHAILHPDPAMNEMWISCNSSFDNVIVDLATETVKEVVPQPNGGSSHNGSFVQYSADWNGELLSDTNGFHGSAVDTKIGMLAQAAAR